MIIIGEEWVEKVVRHFDLRSPRIRLLGDAQGADEFFDTLFESC